MYAIGLEKIRVVVYSVFKWTVAFSFPSAFDKASYVQKHAHLMKKKNVNNNNKKIRNIHPNTIDVCVCAVCIHTVWTQTMQHVHSYVVVIFVAGFCSIGSVQWQVVYFLLFYFCHFIFIFRFRMCHSTYSHCVIQFCFFVDLCLSLSQIFGHFALIIFKNNLKK